MRWNYFITSIFLYPLCSFADPNQFFNTPNSDEHTVQRSIINEHVLAKVTHDVMERSYDYPTQIIRMVQTIENQQLNCKQVNEQIDRVFVNKITQDKFSFATYITCTYNPDTHMATKFTISAYFDPLNDEAFAYLKTYIDEYNGIDLLGSELSIESAKALIVSLNLSVGMKKNPNRPPFIEYREDRSNLYFKSNYELQTSYSAMLVFFIKRF
jgi:hypothetical protein